MSALRVKVGELCEQIRGVTYEKQDVSMTLQPGYLPVLRANNITNDGLIFDDLVFVPVERVAEKQRIRRHDVVVAASSGSIDVVGKAAPALTDFAGTFGAFCKVLRPNAKVHPGYFAHFFKTRHYRQRVSALAAGANINNLRNEHLDEMEIPLPPLAEQRRTVELLDRAEALRVKRRVALAQLDVLTQSLFYDLFGDTAQNDRNWPTARMGDLMQIRRGGSPRPIEKYLGGDINWIKIGDGTRGSDIYLESSVDKITRDGLNKTVFLKKGSLIFANCGVSLGFARILKIDGCIHDGWLSFEDIPEGKLDKLFLLKALNAVTEYFRATAPAGTQPNLNTGLMKNFRIILPPINLQLEFARRVVAVEKLKEAHRASLAEMDALFATLQHRAFQGEL